MFRGAPDLMTVVVFSRIVEAISLRFRVVRGVIVGDAFGQGVVVFRFRCGAGEEARERE